MSESPTEDFEHTEHAMHASHEARGGNTFIGTVAMSIAVLAVVAATVGSLETLESGNAISAKNDAVLLQNKATDSWNFYQAKGVKLNVLASKLELLEALGKNADPKDKEKNHL